MPRASLGSLFHQYMQYGYWKVAVIRKHRNVASWRHLVPASFLSALMLLALLACWSNMAFWGLLALITIYLICNLAASFLAAARSGWRFFALLPVVFACYHLSYGFGFLRGIADFILFRRAPRPRYTRLARTSLQH